MIRDPKKFIPNNEYIPTGLQNATVILFYVDWCPYCKTTNDEYDLYSVNYISKNTGININFNKVNCENQPDLADQYNITEYPTIVLVKDDMKFYYDSNFSEETMDKFIDSTMRYTS
jgi:thiol-disulfide isomerase/thioredoxin